MTGTADAQAPQGAHEHGAALVELVLEGSDVLVHFVSPMYNLVGFEHAPREARDRGAVAAASALLDDPANLVLLHADAACAVVESTSDWDALPARGEEHDHDAHDGHDADEHDGHDADEADHHDDHDDEPHAGVTASVRYTCDRPERLHSLDVTAFESFERLSEVELRAVGPGGAVAASPERGSPTVDLRGLFGR